MLRVLKLYYKVASSHLPAPQIPRVLKLYYNFASSHLPAPHILRVLKLHYKVASSHLPAPQIPRVLKLYYNFASSHLPAPHILRVLKLYYKVASSQLPAPQIAPRTKVVPESRQFSSSSSAETPRTQVVLQSRQFSASSSTDCSAYYSCTTNSPVLSFQLHRGLRRTNPNRTLACISRTRHARSPQRAAPDKSKSHSRLHFVHSTRTISAEGCAGQIQIALSPAFRALDTHDLRRGLRRTNLGLPVLGSRIGVFGSHGVFSSRVGVFGSRGVFGCQVGFWFPRGGVFGARLGFFSARGCFQFL